MIVMNPQGVMPIGPWQLPSEFARPNWTTLSSGSAQQILESRGLLGGGGYGGYGAARPGTSATGGSRRTTDSTQFLTWLSELTTMLTAIGYEMDEEDESYVHPERGTTVYRRVFWVDDGNMLAAWLNREGSEFEGQVNFFVVPRLRPRRRTMDRPAPRPVRAKAQRVRPRVQATSSTQRPQPRVQASRMAGYGMNSAAGARVVERLPWRRYAGQVDLY